MNIRFKNRHIPYTIEFLNKIQLTGKVSRARRKLIQKLQGKFQEIQEDYQSAFEVGENEDIEEERKRKKEENEFLEEVSSVNLSEYQDQLILLAQTLDNYPHELSGADAEMHDLLLDQLEEAIGHE